MACRALPGSAFDYQGSGAGGNAIFVTAREAAPQAFTNSSSSVIATSSPTRTPPVSRVALNVSPKSVRLTLVFAVTPTRVLPQGSFAGGVGPSTSNSTSFVTPCTVSGPETETLPSALRVMWDDLKVIVGNFSTS